MRTIEELLNDKVNRDDMSREEEELFVNYWFSKYEESGFDTIFQSPYEQYAEKNGERFKVIRRCTTKDWNLCCLPAWDIEFEDGKETSAYPEEICLLERKFVPTDRLF